MPATWLEYPEGAPEQSGAPSHEGRALPRVRLLMEPHQSLTPRGFVIFIGVTAALFLLPLLAVLGSPVLWGLLPFFGLAVAGVWYAIRRNQRDAQITEELTLWPDRALLRHIAARGPEQTWEANPYWITVELLQKGGPVPNYIVLKGGPRPVEIGRFLSEEERVELAADLRLWLGRLGN